MLSSRWGKNDPGLDMTGVHLRVLGGRPVWPVAFYQLVATENQHAHVVELKTLADYTPNPLAHHMGGGEALCRPGVRACGGLNRDDCGTRGGGCGFSCAGPPAQSCEVCDPGGVRGDYQPEVSSVCVLCGCSRECF